MKALAPTLAYDLTLTRDLPPLAMAQSAAVPTQVVVGQKRPPGMHVAGSQLALAIPHTELVVLPGQGHLVSARKLLPLLCEFLV